LFGDPFLTERARIQVLAKGIVMEPTEDVEFDGVVVNLLADAIPMLKARHVASLSTFARRGEVQRLRAASSGAERCSIIRPSAIRKKAQYPFRSR
jgi:hypothetical protein